MNNTHLRRHLSPFERSVLAVAKPLLRATILLMAWRFRCAKRPLYRSTAAIALHAIDLMAGAIGAVVWARRWFVSERESSEYGQFSARADSYRATH